MTSGKNLRKNAVSGVFWVAVQRYSIMAVHFVSGIILARLLMPSDYGCIGMLAIFISLSESMVDAGFGSALIQKKRPTQEDYSTIFYWNIIMACVLYVLLYLFAPFISRFYHLPQLCTILRVQGVVLFAHALCIIQSNQLRKQFRFKKLAIIAIANSLISLITTIVLAYRGWGVWALVAQNTLFISLNAIVYWVTCKWRPSRVFSMRSIKELFSFGIYMFLTGLVNTISTNIQGLLIGRLYNPSVMGFYSKAYSTERIASESVSSVMKQVTYPLYAEVQDNKNALINIIMRLTVSLAYITFPLMFVLMLIAKPLFILLYSERWLPAVHYFQILCLAGLATCLQSVNFQAIAAVGKSKVMFNYTILKRFLGILIVVGGLMLYGLEGLMMGVVVSSWTIYLINAWLVSKYIGYKLSTQLLNLSPVLFLSIAVFGVVSLLRFILDFGMCTTYFTLGIVYLSTYVLLSYMFRLSAFNYFLSLANLIVKRVKLEERTVGMKEKMKE